MLPAKEIFNKWFSATLKKPLYSYQERILKDHLQYNVINKSRQTGITTFLAAYGLYSAFKGQKVLVVSPSDRQSKHVMEIAHQFLYTFPSLWKQFKIPFSMQLSPIEEMKTSLRFNNGGELRSLPNSASTVRGFTADIVILDEFAHFLNGTDKEIMEAVAPSLSRNGEFWLVSTPFGERGLFHEYWQGHLETKKFTIHYTECPDLNEKTLRELCPDPLAFAQEYDNYFSPDVETEFPLSLLQTCINSELSYEPEVAKDLWVGVDVGRKVDKTAVIGCTRQENTYVVAYKEVMSRLEFDTQQERLLQLLNTKRIQRLTIDETGIGAQLAEHLQKKHGYKVRKVSFTSEIKEQLILNLKTLLINKQIVLPDDRELIMALNSIKRQYASTGHLRFDADRTDLTGHADTAWALALAVYEANAPSPFFGIR